jgi:hypothetical protein
LLAPLIFDGTCFAHSFFCKPGGSEKLNRETIDEQVLALNAPTALLQIRVNPGNAGGQIFLSRDEDDSGIVGCEWFDVVDRRERAAQGLVFNQAGGGQDIRHAKDIRQRDARFFAHWRLFFPGCFGKVPLNIKSQDNAGSAPLPQLESASHKKASRHPV